jgi:DNA-binding NarL/FixJ family response regulator
LVKIRRPSAWFIIALHVAREDHFDSLEARQAGADVYLLKGLRTADLVTALMRCVSTAEAGRPSR